jgi:hypothetical protein
MAKINQIQNALKELDGGAFQNIRSGAFHAPVDAVVRLYLIFIRSLLKLFSVLYICITPN